MKAKDVLIAQIFGGGSGGGGGGGAVDVNADVRFIDYDGEVVDSYSAAEFASLSALPANPSHDGLVAQGWNWSLADAQAYVAEYGMIDIGQLYLTESGDTEIDIKIPGNNFEIKSYVALNGTISIDWGDGSEPDELTQTSYNAANQAHTYAQAGLYTISIKAVSGSWRMYGNTSTPLNGWLISNPGTLSGTTTRSYMGLIEEVRCGNGLLRIHLGCSGAKAVAMSSGMIVESYGFYENRRLKALIYPPSVTSFGYDEAKNATELRYVSLPKSITTMNSGFSDSVYLDRLCVPPSCTNSPTFPKNIKEGIVPASVTSASAYFQNCNRLEKFVLKANVVSIPTNCFYENWSLKEFEIPQGKTQIASGAFANCYQLKKVNIPASVTSIGNQAFQNCYYMVEIKFEGATPPTVSSSNAFTNLSPICRILVPAGSLSAYQSATNYPSSSTYTYEEY